MEYVDTQIYSPASLAGGISSTASVMARPPRIGGDFHRSPASIKDKHIDILANDLRRSIERLDKVIGKSAALNTGHFSLKNKVVMLNKNSFTGVKSNLRKSDMQKSAKKFAAEPMEKPMIMRIEDPY